ncbi:pseudouridine synthase [Tritonibacter horizontis]|uniref:Pseudouridine synthase n=1 Tax=Tritonibacter horizontis TaxID=1768241 RepID=A0A132C2B1_9RHOB|nr:pseudouridine synthase [Tritonibacter horizontis]KUP94723.1 ribosomal large subunit pseudouridine synthase B [Tritonibacter horizontis]
MNKKTPPAPHTRSGAPGSRPKAKPPAKPRANKGPQGGATSDARPSDGTPEGDRIAKVLSRAGVASRREAERMIAEGRVVVNGDTIDSPALNVTEQDRIIVDGKPLPAAEAPRLWLYHKPAGLVTTNSDEKGRKTVFDALPEDLPRVMTVGRLDLNSEGLLLLTNDGGIKRQLELPSTGWLRRYRVRINGRPQDHEFEPLRKGLVIDGERFQPMTVSLDRQQGANAWLTIGLREGKNREIRRAIEEIGYPVNRLLRVSYGPFQLGTLKEGEVEELRAKVVRDQLGLAAPEGDGEAQKKPQRSNRPTRNSARTDAPKGPGKPGGSKPGGAAAGGPRGAAPPRQGGPRGPRPGSGPSGGAKGPRSGKKPQG